MKKLLCVVFAVVTIISLCACSNSKSKEQLDEMYVKNIFQLATVECYFNNLAMTDVPKGNGVTHLFEKDREFWLEYDGVVEIGIEMEKVSVKVQSNKVVVKMPHATVLTKDFDYDSLKNSKILTDKDSWINKNKITSEDQKEAIKKAQEEMVKTMESNSSMMSRAEERAKLLIENYINGIGNRTGTEYEIEWQYIE